MPEICGNTNVDFCVKCSLFLQILYEKRIVFQILLNLPSKAIRVVACLQRAGRTDGF